MVNLVVFLSNEAEIGVSKDTSSIRYQRPSSRGSLAPA